MSRRRGRLCCRWGLVRDDDLIAAEPGTGHPGLEKCVELKTNKVIDTEKQDNIFHKHVKARQRP